MLQTSSRYNLARLRKHTGPCWAMLCQSAQAPLCTDGRHLASSFGNTAYIRQSCRLGVDQSNSYGTRRSMVQGCPWRRCFAANGENNKICRQHTRRCLLIATNRKYMVDLPKAALCSRRHYICYLLILSTALLLSDYSRGPGSSHQHAMTPQDDVCLFLYSQC